MDDYFIYFNDVLVWANRVLYRYMLDFGLLKGELSEPRTPGGEQNSLPAAPDEAFPLCRLIRLYNLNEFQIYCIALSLLYEARPDYSAVFGDANEQRTVPDLRLAKVSFEHSRQKMPMADFLNSWRGETQSQLLYAEKTPKSVYDTELILNRRIYAFLLGEGDYLDKSLAHVISVRGLSDIKPEPDLEFPLDTMLDALKRRDTEKEYYFFINGKEHSGRKTLAAAVLRGLGKKAIFVSLCSLAYNDENLLAAQIASIKRECILQNAAAVAADFEYLMKESNIANKAAVAALFAESQTSLFGFALFISGSVRQFGNAVSVYIETERQGVKTPRPSNSEILKAKARLITSSFEPEDLILPPNQKWMLRHICHHVSLKPVVYGQWGFAKRFVYGNGLNVLFAGPPGTGKTMAAQIISKEIGLPLFKIDLAQIVSKYIGETEENLRIIFDEAEKCDIILMIDEMDALFGKRTRAKDAHDRYANMETSYLLQRIEHFSGILIMATNLHKNIDEAFMRRINFIVHFPFPSPRVRKQLWESTARGLPLDDSVDFDFLAEKFEVTGGVIKNVILKAAFLAAAEGKAITEGHLIYAVKNELSKQGKVVLDTDFL